MVSLQKNGTLRFTKYKQRKKIFALLCSFFVGYLMPGIISEEAPKKLDNAFQTFFSRLFHTFLDDFWAV
jgi:hypothetical protein